MAQSRPSVAPSCAGLYSCFAEEMTPEDFRKAFVDAAEEGKLLPDH